MSTWLGAVGSGQEALRCVGDRSPDVVLMDLNLPGMPGLEATRRIVASGAQRRVGAHHGG
jgi:CheY-like chemotaxis protein